MSFGGKGSSVSRGIFSQETDFHTSLEVLPNLLVSYKRNFSGIGLVPNEGSSKMLNVCRIGAKYSSKSCYIKVHAVTILMTVLKFSGWFY